jgi:helicase
MSEIISINRPTKNSVINLCLDTIGKDKQALVFVNTKAGSESQAEKIASAIKQIKNKEKLFSLSEKILNVLSKPTKQCKRLALCVKKGSAFHHAGLHSSQREVVEEAFKKGLIKIICATPTLAYGLNLPAFRVIVRDLKRFNPPRGMSYIPVLDYLQFCGRAGRPDFGEKTGEAICIAETDSQKEVIVDKYIYGEPEEILSKLAVEPILRTYILSLVVLEQANTLESLLEFFSKTFYAHQFGNLEKLNETLVKIIKKLEDWGFIYLKEESIMATLMGRRINQLYLDPYTANYLITCIKNSQSKIINEFSFLQAISYTLELRPLLSVKVKEYDDIIEKTNVESSSILSVEPSMFDPEYEEYLRSVKTAMFFEAWINEEDEEDIMEKFNIRPGEIRVKNDRADWLLYSLEEICILMKNHSFIKEIKKLRIRLKNGVKEELIPLLKFKNIGRLRARKLFKNKIKDVEDVKKVDVNVLAQLLGKKLSIDLKKQVGQQVSEEKIVVKKTKRKGQMSLTKYG